MNISTVCQTSGPDIAIQTQGMRDHKPLRFLRVVLWTARSRMVLGAVRVSGHSVQARCLQRNTAFFTYTREGGLNILEVEQMGK